MPTRSRPYVLAHLKTQQTRQDPETRRAWKLRLAKGLYDRGLGAPDVRNLFRFIDWMMDLPRELEDQFLQDVHQYEEEKRMPYITPAERIWMEKGLLKGIELGLEVKFGAEGLKLLPEIRELSDLQVIEEVLQAIKTATTPEQVRQIWCGSSK